MFVIYKKNRIKTISLDFIAIAIINKKLGEIKSILIVI